jgi:hypothetical protein
MKDFIKKNVVLMTILSLSLMFFLFLAAVGFVEWSKVNKSQTALLALRTDIQKLNDEKPYPVKDNLQNIKGDWGILNDKLWEINQLFGKPYRKALQEFAKSLGTDQAKLSLAWSEFYRKNIQKNDLPEQILMRFLKNYSPEQIAGAKKIFKENAEKRSVEQISDSNINELLMDALGIPRKMSPDACKVYIQNMESALFKFASSAEFGNPLIIGEKSGVFNVYDKTSLPPADHISNIIRHYKLIEDFTYRMKGAGIESVKSLQKLNGIEGANDGQFITFSYKIEFAAPSQALRKLIEDMQGAYKDNRIYVIRDIVFSKINDDMKSRISSAASAATEKPDSRTKPNQPLPPPLLAPDIPFVLGLSDGITAELKFDYIIYIGDELKVGR